MKYTATFRKHPPPRSPARGTSTSTTLTSVPELGGSRPDSLAGVRPQERVPRRIVEQIVDSAPVLPLLHDPDPVPQMVDSVEEVRCFFLKRWPVAAEQTWDCEDELVFEMPKILQHMASSRSSLPEPQTAEQLVAVPVIERIIVARGRGAGGVAWCHTAERTWLLRVHDTGWEPPPAQGVCKYWAQVRLCGHAATYSSSLRWTVDGASLQFFDRVVDIAVMLRDRYAQCYTVLFLDWLLTCPLLCMSRSSSTLSCFPWSSSADHRDSPVAVH